MIHRHVPKRPVYSHQWITYIKMAIVRNKRITSLRSVILRKAVSVKKADKLQLVSWPYNYFEVGSYLGFAFKLSRFFVISHFGTEEGTGGECLKLK